MQQRLNGVPGLQQVSIEGRNVNTYVYIRESNVVLQTLIKNKACARTRIRSRRWRLPRARGWTAPRPHPGTRRASGRAAALSASAPPEPRSTFSAGSTPPRSLLQGRRTDPFLRQPPVPLKAPRRAPHGAQSPTSQL